MMPIILNQLTALLSNSFIGFVVLKFSVSFFVYREKSINVSRRKSSLVYAIRLDAGRSALASISSLGIGGIGTYSFSVIWVPQYWVWQVIISRPFNSR